MRLLLFAFLAVFPFGQLGRLEIAPTVNLHLLDIFAGIVGLTWLFGARKKLPRKLPFWPMIVFGVVASFSLIVGAYWVTGSQALVGGFYLLRWFAYVLFLLAVFQYTSQFGQKRRLLETLLLIGAAVAVGGLVQYFLFPDIRPLALVGWDPHYYRLVGTFLDAGFVGILLVFFTLLALSRVETRRVGWGKQLILPVIGVITVAMTFSRASYLALVVGLLAFYIVRRNVWIVGGALALLALTVAVLPRPGGEGVNLARTATVAKRLSNYQQSAETIKKSPLFGVGFNLYRYRKAGAESQDLSHSAAGSDSSILFVAATTGIVGLIAFLSLWGKILQMAWSRRKSSTGLVLFTSSVAVLVHSIFDNSLFYPWVLGWMWILVAENIKQQGR